MMAWKCVLCLGFLAIYLQDLLAHFNSFHRSDNNFHIQCGLDGCSKQFGKSNSFCRHVRSVHRQHLFDTTCEESQNAFQFLTDDRRQVESDTNDSSNSSSESMEWHNAIEETQYDHDDVHDSTSVSEQKSLHELAGQYVVKIKEGNRLTNRATQNIVSSTAQLFQTGLKLLQERVQDCLAGVNMEVDDVPGLDDAFQEVSQPFEGLLTARLQEEFYKTHLKYVEPKRIVLGTSRSFVKRKKKRRIVEVEEAFYYIPLLESLQVQLCSPKLLEIILSGPSKSNTPGTLNDFCNGTFMSEHHPLFSCDSKAINILVYYDDVNIVNPLSNKAHSLGFFYYQLANLPPKYRSKLKSIHLLAICHKKYIKKYGLNKIFEPLVEDLKSLAIDDRGYPFAIDGIGTLRLRGAMLLLLADTPASQAAGCFKEGVGGARRKCRHCMATFETMQQFFTEEEFVLRSKESHEEQLRKLEQASSPFLAEFYSKEYGINSRSKLLEAPYFDVCEQLPQDVMHVFLEGILSYHLKYLLQHYLFEERAFSLEDLNKDVQNFPLGYSEQKDRPVSIKQADLDFKASTNLGQSASRMHLLVRILPFILGKYVDMTTDHWHCFLSALDVMVLCLSHSVTCASLVYLKNAIRLYLRSFKGLYNARITPKLHYLVHMPSLMFKFGPLIRSWCMRMEAKHSHFKNLARIVKNFQNLPYTLSTRYQTMEASDLITLDDETDPCPLFANEIEFGNAKHIVDVNEFKHATECLQNFYGIHYQRPDGIFLLDSVTVHGTRYKPGENNYLVVSTEQPEFGRFKKVWQVLDYGIFFVLQMMHTEAFREDLNAFEITEPQMAQGNEIRAANDLVHPYVYHSYKFQQGKFITRREFDLV